VQPRPRDGDGRRGRHRLRLTEHIAYQEVLTLTRKRLPYAAASIVCFVLFLALGIYVEWGDQIFSTAARAGSATASPWTSGGATPAALPGERYADVAAAFRAGDLEAAEELLAALTGDDRAATGDARLVVGLAAFARGDHDAAREHLTATDVSGALLGDWRLAALAEMAAEDGDRDAALLHWSELVESYPRSPLRPGAMVDAAELYARAGDHRAALDLVSVARSEGLAGRARADLEELAWNVGRTLGDDSVRREAARRLLTHSPYTASALGVPKLFRGRDGRVDWSRVLTPAELEQRARSFLDLTEAGAALAALEDVRSADRGLGWTLLQAEALTRLHRGQEALATLDLARPATGAQRAAVAWHRALAAADLATARGGGKGLPTAERRAMRLASLRHLEEVSAHGGDDELAVRALRRLYKELDGASFARQKEVLRELRRHDPTDRTGAAPLWEKGWAEYGDGNHTAAIAYWTELDELYPDDREAHRGSYWKARALEDLGQDRRAGEIYRKLIASSDTTDFYRKQAMARLGLAGGRGGFATAQLVSEERPWEIDPSLRRAKLFVDLGLDEMAEREIALVEATVDDVSRQDRRALEALMLARQGKLRKGIVQLKQAFPGLGGAAQAEIPTEILRAYYPLRYEETIREEAQRVGVPAHFVAGIIRQESAFDSRATSPVGARGLMQVMPATAREVATSLGESYSPARLYDPAFSIKLGTTYFKRVLDMFDGNVELALAGYNGGPNRMRRLWKEQGSDPQLDDWLENLTIDESRNYVKRILVLADSYRQLYPEDTPRLDA